MGMWAEVEPLDSVHVEPQHHEMLRQRRSLSELFGERPRGVQRICWGGPPPDSPSRIGQPLPALLAKLRLLGGCDQLHLPP